MIGAMVPDTGGQGLVDGADAFDWRERYNVVNAKQRSTS